MQVTEQINVKNFAKLSKIFWYEWKLTFLKRIWPTQYKQKDTLLVPAEVNAKLWPAKQLRVTNAIWKCLQKLPDDDAKKSKR